MLYTAFVVQLLVVRGGDISIFVVAGGGGVDAQRVPPGLTVIPNIGGYDGVAFYRLSLEPWTRKQIDRGVALDNPPYRQQRIGYPLLVWALSLGGKPMLVPRMLVGVNLIAVVVMAAIGAALAQSLGRQALWGLVFPFYPGFLMTLSRDLSEIVASCFALAAILALTRRRFGMAAFLLTYAIITRETTLLIAIALAATYLFDRIRRLEPRVPPVTFIAPLAVYAGWQLLLAKWWGTLPIRPGSRDVAFPLSEYARVFGEAMSRASHVQRVYFLECLFLAVVVLIVIVEIVRARPPLQWGLAWAGALALASVLPAPVWAEDVAFMRVLGDLFIMSAVIVVGYGWSWARTVMMIMTGSFWYYLAIDIVMRP